MAFTIEGIPLSLPLLHVSSFSRNDLIHYYCLSGFNTATIQMFLRDIHGYYISRRHIRRLRNLYGECKNTEDTIQTISMAILNELNGSGSLLGYRMMWNRLRFKYQLSVRRDTVMWLLPILDPIGSHSRSRNRLKRRVYRSKGPNCVWHCDGYDKLKPFGFAIHGCIDGYSRRILWLHCGNTNNNPEVIANLYVKTVRHLRGVPRVLRTDRGTENSIIAFIQPTLRSSHGDTLAGVNSFRYGRSISNQRIEAWWAFLRARMIDWWITFFRDFFDECGFDDSLPQNLEALQFSFTPVIQNELNDLVFEWNHHHIRQSKYAEAPGGIPEVLYFLPEQSGANNHKCFVDMDLLDYAENTYTSEPKLCSSEFKEYAEFVIANNSCTNYPPTTVSDAMAILSLLINDM